MNVTVTQADGTGFLTVFPTGSAGPGTVPLENFVAGTTAPNFTIARRSAAQGKVSFFVQGPSTHVIIDVTGYFLPAAPPPPPGGSSPARSGPHPRHPHGHRGARGALGLVRQRR